MNDRIQDEHYEDIRSGKQNRWVKLLCMTLFITCMLGYLFFGLGPTESTEEVHVGQGIVEHADQYVNEHGDQHDHQQQHLLLWIVPGLSMGDMRFVVNQWAEPVHKDIQMAGMSMRTAGKRDLNQQWWTMLTGKLGQGPNQWMAESHEKGAMNIQLTPAMWENEADGWEALTALRETELFGEQLKKEAIHSYVLGNSDIYLEHRLAPFLVMDGDGQAQGWIEEEMLSTDFEFPTHKKTDFNQLTTAVKNIWEHQDRSLFLIESGDLRRIEHKLEQAKKNHTTAEDFQRIRKQWLNEWSKHLSNMWTDVQQRDTQGEQVSVWVVAPFVSAEAVQEEQWLSPWLILSDSDSPDSSMASPQWFTSDTTRQDGVVSNLDFLPSLYHFFGLDIPDHLVGKPVYANVEAEKSAPLWKTQTFFDHMDHLFSIYEHRQGVLTTYLIMMIGSLIASTIYWFFYQGDHSKNIVQVLIGALLVSPLFFLLLTPVVQWMHAYVWFMLLFVLSLGLSTLLHRYVNEVQFLMVIGLANTVVIVYDLWQGSVWMQRSFLGYDPLIGARFYGIGNEYAGILLGSSLLAATGIACLFSRVKMVFWLFSAGFAVIVYAMAAPHLGTNAGATIACFVAYGSFLYTYWLPELRLKHVIGGSAILVGFMLLFGWMHAQGAHTHIGAALQHLEAGRTDVLAEMVKRKWEMNAKLLRHSLWGKLFLTSLVVLGLVHYRLQQQVRLQQQDRQLSVSRMKDTNDSFWPLGFRVMLIGAVAILAVNDSGIVAAAALIIYVAFPYLYLRFELTEDEDSAKDSHSSSS